MARLPDVELMAPPTEEELMAPPSDEELAGDTDNKPITDASLMTPPTEEELMAPPTEDERRALVSSPASKLPQPGVGEAALRGVAQGALFEFADEGEAGLRSFLQNRDYKAELKRIRADYKAAEEAHPGVTMAANVAGGLAAAAVPGLGAIGVAGKGARLAAVAGAGALQGGLSALGHAEKDDFVTTAKEVGQGAILGAGLGAAVKGLGAMGGGSKILGKLKDFASNKSRMPEAEVDLLKLAGDAYAPKMAADMKFAKALHAGDSGVLSSPENEQRLKEFAYYLDKPSTVSPENSRLGMDKAMEILEGQKARLSEKDFAGAYVSYRELQAFKGAAKGIVNAESGIKSAVQSGINAISDGTYVARDLDHRLGTSVSEILLDGTEKINHYQIDLARWIKTKAAIPEIPKEVETQVAKAIDEGKIGLLPPELQHAATEWKKFYSDAADYAKSIGVPIQKREDYLPRKMISMPEAIVKIRERVKDLGGLNQAAAQPSEELQRAVTYFNGGETIESGSREFKQMLDKMMQPGSDAFIKEKVASALFKREDLLPPFLQETSLRKLSNSWLMETLRYGHMKETLADLSRQRDMLEVAGAERDVAWMDNLVNDYLGGARGLAKITRNGMGALQVAALEGANKAKPNSVAKHVYGMVAEAPDAIQNLVMNVYPNFLGMSPRAMVQNVAGGFYTMMPELGLTYGAERGTTAYAQAINNITKSPKAYFAQMEKSGFIAPQWTSELKDTLKTKKPGVVGKGLDATAEFAMKGFEYSEKLNRAVAWETGKLLTKDLLMTTVTGADAGRNTKAALNFLNTMPPSLSKKAHALRAEGNGPELEKLVTKYFADRTLFSYNRLTQSELARAAGPLFSMFTKFPAAVSGQIASAYREKGAFDGSSQITRKLIAPYVAGSILNDLIFDKSSAGVQEYLFGKEKPGATLGQGIASASPFGAVKSILDGRVFTPPVVGTVKELGGALVEADPDRLARWAKSTAQAFAPGGAAAYYRVIKQHAELAGLLDEEE